MSLTGPGGPPDASTGVVGTGDSGGDNGGLDDFIAPVVRNPQVFFAVVVLITAFVAIQLRRHVRKDQ